MVSEHILAEFARHATEKFGAPGDTINEAISLIRAHAQIVEPYEVPADSCRDADDLPILGAALAGQADAIVTGDRDLLVLRKSGSAVILAPRKVYDRLSAG
jgi:putative PIN family toxin of toxin-antitoxin system